MILRSAPSPRASPLSEAVGPLGGVRPVRRAASPLWLLLTRGGVDDSGVVVGGGHADISLKVDPPKPGRCDLSHAPGWAGDPQCTLA